MESQFPILTAGRRAFAEAWRLPSSARRACLTLLACFRLAGLSLAQEPWIERLPASEARAEGAWPAPIVPPWYDHYQPPPNASLAGFFDPNADLVKPDQSPLPMEGTSIEPLPDPAFSESFPPKNAAPQLPPGAKAGVLQRVILQGTWLPAGGAGDGFGMTDFDARVSLGFPFPTVQTPLVVTPGYGAHYLDGPQATEAPAAAYDAYLDVMWKLPFWGCWNVDLAITPGWYSDYQQSSSDALRIGGRALFSYTMSPQHRFMLGAVYLDREDIAALPVAGWIWTPNDDVRLELVAPRPKFSNRFWRHGEFDSWWYLAGEFGGGSWAIAGANGTDDVLNYSDWRGVVGLETKRCGTIVGWLETGYVFNRRISYNSGAPDFDPSGTFMLRAGWGY